MALVDPLGVIATPAEFRDVRAVMERNAQALKPFHHFALADGSGTNVIVSARSGEVAQVATRTQRACHAGKSVQRRSQRP